MKRKTYDWDENRSLVTDFHAHHELFWKDRCESHKESTVATANVCNFYFRMLSWTTYEIIFRNQN